MSIEITDEMVDRAVNAWFDQGGDERWRDSVRQQIRASLQAALNPPPAPEIVVTEAMAEAGAGVLTRMVCEGCPHDTLVVLVYRAMRRLEPKPEETVSVSRPKFKRVVEGVPVWYCGDERKGERRGIINKSFGQEGFAGRYVYEADGQLRTCRRESPRRKVQP